MIIEWLRRLSPALAAASFMLGLGGLRAAPEETLRANALDPAALATLEGESNQVSLTLALNATNANQLPAGGFLIRAGAELLFRSSPAGGEVGPGMSRNDYLSVVNPGKEDVLPATARVLERCAAADWDYLALDLIPSPAARTTRWERRVLRLRPDMVVILDRVQTPQPAEFRFALASSHPWIVDNAWGNATSEQGPFGITAHLLAHPRKALGEWKTASEGGARHVLTNGTGGRCSEFSAFGVFVTGPKDHPRSITCKLLESPNALGVRIHRDGLPTLLAFRKEAGAGRSTLAGLTFSGPVGVDVYRPRAGRH